MPTPTLVIRLRHSPAFAVQSHGWCYLVPFEIDGDRLHWAVRLPNGGARRVTIRWSDKSDAADRIYRRLEGICGKRRSTGKLPSSACGSIDRHGHGVFFPRTTIPLTRRQERLDEMLAHNSTSQSSRLGFGSSTRSCPTAGQGRQGARRSAANA
jgi:hypothetical protein